MDEPLKLYTLYRFPRDLPDKWVIRLSVIGEGHIGGTHTCWIADTREEVVAQAPVSELTWIDRHREDHPVIQGVYL